MKHRGKSFRRVSGAHIGRVARRVWVCPWCSCQHDHRDVATCQSCKRPMKALSFSSLGEANRWAALRLQEDRDMISGLRRQVRFPMQTVNPSGLLETYGTYIADFTYTENGEIIVEDFKSDGVVDPTAALKLRYMRARFGKEVRITT